MTKQPDPERSPASRSAGPERRPTDGFGERHPSDVSERRFRYRSEFSRLRDANAQFAAWELNYAPEGFAEVNFGEHVDGKACPDSALAAFTQLCALRMNSRCAMVSILGAEHEYVLSELNHTTPFQRTLDNTLYEPLALGVCKFARESGLASKAADEWRQARRARDTPTDSDYYYTNGLTQHSLIVNDIRHDAAYKDCPISQHIRWMRFYCSVPLRGAQGSVIGQLAVFDDKPRYGVSCAELSLLEDLADTIVEHLDSLIVRAQRQAGERHLQALTLFNTGKDSLRDWWSTQEDARVLRTGRAVVKGTAQDRQNRIDAEFGLQTDTSVGSTARPRDANSYFDYKQTDQASSDLYPSDARPNEIHAPANTIIRSHPRQAIKDVDADSMFASVYSRAINLLREGLGATGAVLLDARNATSAGLQRGNEKHDVHSSTSSDSQTEDGSSACDIFGFSIHVSAVPVTANAASVDQPFTLSRTALRRVIKQHPGGGVVHFDEEGILHLSSDSESKDSSEEDPKRQRRKSSVSTLGKAAVGVRTMAFLPLWDQYNNRWHSFICVWSNSPMRVFDLNQDLLYLSTFAQAIASETAYVQSLAMSQVKDTFISSISHELRSPLHGILAGVEFLQDTDLTAFQSEMTHAIQTAGRVLLDTVDHVLDYSKISKRSRASRRSHSAGSPGAAILGTPGAVPSAPVDMAQLTEEVIDTCLVADRSQQASAAKFSGMPTSDAQRQPQLPSGNKVAVTLNVAHIPNWTVRIQSGAWIRILTNLVGNALKYTQTGYVSIDLTGSETSPGLLSVQLVVEDTGCGMSKSYLENSLFVPFKQEDPFCTGTGLGLSIVKSLVDGLDGNMSIKSKQNVGTGVHVRFVANLVPATQPSTVPEINVEHVQLISKDPEDAEDTDESHNAGVTRQRVESSIVQNAENWLDCQTTLSYDSVVNNTTGKAVCAITEEVLGELLRHDEHRLLEGIAEQYAHLVVIASTKTTVQLKETMSDLPMSHVFIHQPIGPRKLLRAIASDQHSTLHKDAATSEPSAKSKRATIASQGITLDEDRLRGISSDREARRDGAKSPQLLANGVTEALTISDTSSAPDLEGVSDEPDSTVLLVEDNDINMKFLVALMKKIGVPHHCAMNGHEAVKLYRKYGKLYMLVLMDMSMPIMDGYTATIEIRRLEAKYKFARAYITALTGVTSQESMARAFDCGVDHFYSKPVTMKEVQALLTKIRSRNEQASST